MGPSKRNSLSKDPARYSMSFASPREGCGATENS